MAVGQNTHGNSGFDAVQAHPGQQDEWNNSVKYPHNSEYTQKVSVRKLHK